MGIRATPARVRAETEEGHRTTKGRAARQDWSGPELGLAARTVNRILRRHRVPYRPECDRSRPRRSLWCATNATGPADWSTWTIVKLGRVTAGGGWRAHRRTGTVRDRAICLGFDYVHSLVGGHSRLAYSEVPGDEKGSACAGFLAHAADFVRARGIDLAERFMTRIAWPTSTRCANSARSSESRRSSSAPCPWQIGKVERLTQTLQSEWPIGRCSPRSTSGPSLPMARPLQHSTSPHSAFEGFAPISRLQPT